MNSVAVNLIHEDSYTKQKAYILCEYIFLLIELSNSTTNVQSLLYFSKRLRTLYCYITYSYTHIGRIKQAVLCVSCFSIPLAISLCGSYLSYSHRSHTGSIVLLD